MRARSLTVIAAASLLALVSCSSSSSGSASGSAGAAPGASALGQATGPVTVTLWHGLGGPGGEALNARIAEFNASHSGKIVVKASFQGNYADTLAKYTAALRDGGTPSVLVTNDITTGFVHDAGQTIPAQDLAAANPGDLDLATLRPAARNYYTAQGKLLAVPLATSMPLLYVHDDLLAKAGVDKATLGTLNGVAAAARQVTARTGVPGLVEPFDGWWFEQLAAGSGQPYCTPGNGREGGGATALTLAPQTRAAVTTVAKLYLDKVGLNTGTDGNNALSAFAAGKVAMMINSSGSIGGLRKAGAKAWSALAYPLSGAPADSGALIGGAAMWVDAKGHSAAEQVASWKLISYLASAKAQEPFSQASGYAPVASAVDDSPTEKAFLAANPPYETLRRQFTGTPAGPATAGCLSGAMSGIRSEVVSRMQAAFTGMTPVDSALDQAQQAGTAKIVQYRKQAGL
jgi:sn-glycerol 3-phosphate transport system substrate-binding protein